MSGDIARRFAELDEQANKISASKKANTGQYAWGNSVDERLLLNWRVKVRHLLGSACGSDSEHLKQFRDGEELQSMQTSHDVFERLYPVFLAAKEDFEGGYLNTLRVLLQSELFDSELDQADELLGTGYKVAAAVVAGVVLETGLREMCADKQLSVGKLDKMNADLAKAGVYNKLVQKQITALADIRNNAAHGHPEQFTDEDVKIMIRDVRRILAARTTKQA
jgi:hypothetical protein